jgi:uncharacterized spore protein YtfJ
MNVDEMLTGARDVMNVKRVYGDPIERDGVLVIPAAKVAGGGGGGGDSENNAGGGFGVRAVPAGAWIIRQGDDLSALYMIIEGEVTTVIDDEHPLVIE